jgi:hypothetical protein
MKKFLFVLFAGLRLVLSSGGALAQGVVADGVTSGGCIWEITGVSPSYTLTIKGNSPMGTYTLPSFIPWHDYRSGIVAVVIGEGVTTVSSYAFADCSKLTSAAIPASVTDIGVAAFRSCSGLASVGIPEGVRRIGNSAFFGCSKLTAVDISKTAVASIGYDVFCACSNMESVALPEGLVAVGEGAFESCRKLTAVIVPSSVVSIGAAAFSGCSKLASVTLGESVAAIGSAAFQSCAALTSITILRLKPQAIASDVFGSGFLSKVTLTVPTSSVAAYGSADVWKDAKSIAGGGVLLGVKASNGSLGRVAGGSSGLYPAGTAVKLTATPTAGYSLLGWKGGSAALGSAAAITFTSVLLLHRGAFIN